MRVGIIGLVMDLEWWEKPVRMMRLDYGADLQRVMETDLDELARWKKEDWNVNCEWVIGTPGIAPGLGHLTTFNTPKFEKYPSLGDFDLIRKYLPHAHKHGLKVLAYLNMHWYSYEFGNSHPEWEQRTADGRSYGRIRPLYGSGTTMCVNTPWRDWAFRLIQEATKTGIEGVFLDGPVVFPGCCYCKSCQEKFEDKYGKPIPAWEDWRNPLWKTFIGFREDSMSEFLRDAQRALLRINPEGVIFLNAGSWRGGVWRVARNIEKVGAYQNFNGAEAFFHPGPRRHILLFWAMAAKHLVAGGKPAVVFNHHCLGPWHYIPMPPEEMKRAVAQTVACGANPWFAVFDYALDHSRQGALQPVQEIQGFLARNEEYFTATSSKADVALLYSSQSSTFYLSDLNEIYMDPGTGVERDLAFDEGTGKKLVDWKKRKEICDELHGNTFEGYFAILTREHIPFDVTLDKQLKRDNLAKYQTLIIANAACLSESQCRVIKDFVLNGGGLIASFEAGCYDEKGNPRDASPLWEVLGVRRIETIMQPRGAEEYIRFTDRHTMPSFRPGQLVARPIYSLGVEAEPSATMPCVFLKPTGRLYSPLKGDSKYPAIVANRAGEGRAVYLPYLLGEFYTRYRTLDHQKILSDCLRWTHRRSLPIQTDAPSTVQVELRGQERSQRLLIHLVNNTGDMQRPMSESIPIREIKVLVKLPKPKRVFTLREKRELRFKTNGGWTQFNVPLLEVYDVVVVES